MKEEILKIISDNSLPKHFCEYGKGVFANANQVGDIADEIVKLFTKSVVTNGKLNEISVDHIKEFLDCNGFQDMERKDSVKYYSEETLIYVITLLLGQLKNKK